MISAASGSALSGEGTLLKLEVTGLAGGESTLSWESFIFNEGTPSSSTQDGSIEVQTVNVPPTVSIDKGPQEGKHHWPF
ncbi:MAG: hypothetical protein U5K69_04200 [Balneolaceae bacterium]|nr:hypothetical protein [Balneolaceae bacterium]